MSTASSVAASSSSAPAALEPAWLRVLRQRLARLNYGIVSIVVHDGRVQQIDVTEKTRLRDDPQRVAAKPS